MAERKELTVMDEARGRLTRMTPEFAKMLPAHIRPEQFTRTVCTALANLPKLLECDRNSLYSAAMKAARDGLLPDGREAALVPFKGQVQYIPMIGGILKRMRNSGDVKDIDAHVVYKDDEFEVVLGDTPCIRHKRNLSGECLDEDIIAVYAVCHTADGGTYREVMTRAEVERTRKVSRSATNQDGPWVNWWGEMARKSVLRRLSKRLPMSTDIVDLIQRDDEDTDLDQPAETQETGPRASRLDTLMRGQSPAANPIEDPPVIEGELSGDGL